MTSWHLITGEYPPAMGGVSDYTALLAQSLADSGVVVHVWCTGEECAADRSETVRVHRMGRQFTPRVIAQLNRALDLFPGPRTLLLQYTPHAFGYKAMNLPFAAWVATRKLHCGDDVRIMFHEVTFPWVHRPLRHNLVAIANRIMAVLLLRGCSRAYVSIPAWAPLLRRLGAGRTPIAWTPVPSNVPTDIDPVAVAARRAELGRGPVIGHFGTYGYSVTALLEPALRTILQRTPDLRVVLLGSGGERWRERLRGDWERVTATGPLPAVTVAEYLRACDLVVQPYPDGTSSRRTSVMAALANGVPVLTTLGSLSEPLWSNDAVAAVPATDIDQLVSRALELLTQPELLRALGAAGRSLYEDHFAIERTVGTLLNDSHGAFGCPPFEDC